MRETEVSIRQLDIARFLRGCSYFGIVCGGILVLVWPSAVMRSSVGQVDIAWAILLLVGGASSLYGSVTDKWIGEYAGIIPIFISLLCYAIAVALIYDDNDKVAYGFGTLMLAFGFATLARLRDVIAVKRGSEELAKGERG